MSEIRVGQVVLFYLFDVAETVKLQQIHSLVSGSAIPARLAPKPATPPYVQYDNPPLSIDGDALGIGDVEGFRARFRFYDYGVISLALTRPFSGSWQDLIGLSQTLIENDDFEERAEQLCRKVAGQFESALVGARQKYLTEDYYVVAVSELAQPQTGDELVATHGDDIAAILRGERQPLSVQEKTKILRHRISYLADDLVVPSWNAAFVYDTPAGVAAALEIMEFANSQLLEFRYYDDRLDKELEVTYASVQKPRWYHHWIGSAYTRAARQVHARLIEFNELTDRTENALKFIGDIYAARLFFLVGNRLGLETWKADVEAKLKTLDDIYGFAVEQSSMSRGQFLELTIVLILIFELVLIFLGVMT